ncbi:MAG: hypothetical protein QOD95_2631, partial [Gammaproteobacteria bacterium]|nr:hypothetical protein [Gammaproteobacteria bacterium]
DFVTMAERGVERGGFELLDFTMHMNREQ